MKFFKSLFIFLIFSASLFGGVFVRYLDENFLLVRRADFFRAQVVLPESQLVPQRPSPTPHTPNPSAEGGSASGGKPYTLLFVGDIMLARGVEHYINKYGGGDFRYPFLKIAEFLNQADLVFGNLEGPVSMRGKNQGSIYSFRMNPKAIEGLKFAGFDVLSLANNHIWDWGREALEDTLALIRANGSMTVGAGRNYEEANTPARFTISARGARLPDGQGSAFGGQDTRVTIFAFTNLYPKSLEATASRSGISQFEPEIIKQKIAEALACEKRASALAPLALRQCESAHTNTADIIVVSFHWGEEYKISANKFQKSLAHELIDAGADLIIGHHPHVVQEVEHYKNGWIFYSLGNFIFDQNFSKDTKKGIIVKVIIRDKKIISAEPVEINFTPTFQPEIKGL